MNQYKNNFEKNNDTLLCEADLACGVTSLNSPTNLLVERKKSLKSPIGSRKLIDYHNGKPYTTYTKPPAPYGDPWVNYQTKLYNTDSYNTDSYRTDSYRTNSYRTNSRQTNLYPIDEYARHARPSQLPRLNEIIERMANIDQQLYDEQEKNNRLLQLLDLVDAKLNRLIEESSLQQTKCIHVEK